MQFDNLHAESRGRLATVCDVAAGICVLLWTVIRVPVYFALVICEPVLRISLTTIGLLGIFSSIVLAFSGAAPHFPFWGAMLFFVGCGALPPLYRAALRVFAP